MRIDNFRPFFAPLTLFQTAKKPIYKHLNYSVKNNQGKQTHIKLIINSLYINVLGDIKSKLI